MSGARWFMKSTNLLIVQAHCSRLDSDETYPANGAETLVMILIRFCKLYEVFDDFDFDKDETQGKIRTVNSCLHLTCMRTQLIGATTLYGRSEPSV